MSPNPLRPLRRPPRPASRGQFLVGVVAFMAVLLIIIQAMVYFSRTETKWTAKERRTMTAFYLAETAVNRAIWRLKETDTAFTEVLTDGAPDGYRNDVVYDDVPGGTYRVNMTTTGANEITIVGTGKDTSANEFRAVTVVLRQTAGSLPTGSVMAASISLPTAGRIFWGPIHSAGTLTLNTDTNQLFPRKYARSSITIGSGVYANRDSDPTDPNTDNLEWWSFDKIPVPDPPNIDFAWYKTQAQGQGRYYSSGSVTLSNQVQTSSSTVYYFDTGVTQAKFRFGTYIYGTIISFTPTLWFDGTGKSPDGEYAVTPHADAWKEYMKNTPSAGFACGGGGGGNSADDGLDNTIPANYTNNVAAEADKSCVDQYPGDGGDHVGEPYNFNTGCTDHARFGGAFPAPLQFRGYLYVGGLLKSSNILNIYGRVQFGSGATWGTGSIQMFHDPTVEPRLASAGGAGGFTQLSWREVVATPF